MRDRRYAYTSPANDEKVSGRALLYVGTQHGIQPSASVCADVWKWTGWSNVYRSCSRSEESNPSVRKETLQNVGSFPWMALQK